ncbi:GNAT family N-acetyltransferase [Evansella tamaricis]|uniref:GNAT family N-acetyltransferase n=1 Tax=Evansella tamaricis TaxID=2069301 RepID=A0ABS6JGN5_9BACI|nr:GNAT family N-acetyltransferase [Evansella tamaricis]MBU9712847.1 GNAT family N-acetyltransferase [Evansella tamaricis]
MMEDFEVKQLTEEDAYNYLNLRLEALKEHPEAFATTYKEMIVKDDPLEFIEQYLSSAELYTFGIYTTDELVAVATLRLNSLEKMKHKGDLLGMYVSPGARKKGLARKLIKTIVSRGEDLGLEQIRLMVVSENDTAVQFYSSLGFEKYGFEKNAMKFDGKYWDEELMVRFLSSL